MTLSIFNRFSQISNKALKNHMCNIFKRKKNKLTFTPVYLKKKITFSPFPTMFSKAVFLNVNKSHDCVLKDQKVNRWTELSLHTSTISQHFLLLSHCFQKFSPTMSSLDCVEKT